MFRYLAAALAAAAVVAVAVASQYAKLGLPKARSGHLRPCTARRLAASRWGHVWAVLAGNPRIPADVGPGLLTGGENVHMGLTGNPGLPMDLQEVLVDDEWDAAVVNVAGNPGLAPQLQETVTDTAGAGRQITLALVQRTYLSLAAMRLLLAGHRHPATMVALGERNNCGPSRRWGVRDLDTGVRGAAIAAHASDPHCVERAAVHRDHLVRVAATANPHLPAEALQKLIGDCDTEVRLAAQQRILDTLVAVR